MSLGQGTELLKIDLSNAYRIVIVHPSDQPLLGISWQGKKYVKRSLPFGLKSSPKILFLPWLTSLHGPCIATELPLSFIIWTTSFSSHHLGPLQQPR